MGEGEAAQEANQLGTCAHALTRAMLNSRVSRGTERLAHLSATYPFTIQS